MTTPRAGLDEMIAAQSQPHLIFNEAIRALEVLGQLTVKSLSDPTDSPFVSVDGDAWIVPTGTAIPEWVLHEGEVAYYASGWYFLTPLPGWIAWIEDVDAYYRLSNDSPPVWELLTLPSGADAYATDYLSAASPGPESGVETVGDALDELYERADDADQRGYDAEVHAQTLRQMGIPISIPGKPGAAAAYHIIVPFPMAIAAGLPGTDGYSGTLATSTATFTLYKNGVSFGTIAFGSGSTHPALTSAAGATLVAGDRLTIIAPTSQDATLADVGFTIKASRTL